ncbi:META domain-containing protein [Alsobacter sp. SYSU BS001988]
MRRRSPSAQSVSLMGFAAAGLAALVASHGAAMAQQKGGRPAPPQEGGVVVPKPQKTFPTDVQWTLVSMGGKSVSGGERPTISLDGQFRARGFGGCNTFSATAYPLQQQHFAVGPIAATKKACDKSVMEFERSFLLAFRTSQLWDTKDGYLIIQSQRGELRFQRSI